MKKTTKKNARLRSIDAAQLAQVGGGRTAQQYAASIQMLELAMSFAPGSAWNEFFAAAAEA